MVLSFRSPGYFFFISSLFESVLGVLDMKGCCSSWNGVLSGVGVRIFFLFLQHKQQQHIPPHTHNKMTPNTPRPPYRAYFPAIKHCFHLQLAHIDCVWGPYQYPFSQNPVVPFGEGHHTQLSTFVQLPQSKCALQLEEVGAIPVVEIPVVATPVVELINPPVVEEELEEMSNKSPIAQLVKRR